MAVEPLSAMLIPKTHLWKASAASFPLGILVKYSNKYFTATSYLGRKNCFGKTMVSCLSMKCLLLFGSKASVAADANEHCQ